MVALTVTATAGGATGNGIGMRVFSLTGAFPVAGQNGTTVSNQFSATTTWTQAIQDIVAGDNIYGTASHGGSGVTATAVSTTIIDDVADATNNEQYVTWQFNNAGSTSVTRGFTLGSAESGPFVMAEIRQDGNLVRDSHAPGYSTATGTTTTTASFSPPPGALLIAMVAANGGAGVVTMTVTDNLPSHLNWKELVKNNPSNGDYAGIWIADVMPIGQLLPIPQLRWQRRTQLIPVTSVASSGGGSATASDSFPWADSLTRSQTQSRSLADSFPGFADQLTDVPVNQRLLLIMPRPLRRSTLIPTSPVPANLFATASDSFPWADVLTRSQTESRALTDSFPWADVLTRSQTQSRGLSDSIVVSDALTRSQTESRGLSDSVSVSDALTRSQTESRSLTDSVPLADVQTHMFAITRGTSDNFALADQMATRFSGHHQFTPPWRPQPLDENDPIHMGRYNMAKGVSVLKINGVYITIEFPTDIMVNQATEVYYGGHSYRVSAAVAAALVAAGYQVDQVEAAGGTADGISPPISPTGDPGAIGFDPTWVGYVPDPTPTGHGPIPSAPGYYFDRYRS